MTEFRLNAFHANVILSFISGNREMNIECMYNEQKQLVTFFTNYNLNEILAGQQIFSKYARLRLK